MNLSTNAAGGEEKQMEEYHAKIAGESPLTATLERLVAVEQRSKGNAHRIRDLEVNQAAIHEMALAVRELATQMKDMKEEQGELNDRLTAIERKPADRLSSIVTAIISAAAGAVITAIAGGILLH